MSNLPSLARLSASVPVGGQDCASTAPSLPKRPTVRWTPPTDEQLIDRPWTMSFKQTKQWMRAIGVKDYSTTDGFTDKDTDTTILWHPHGLPTTAWTVDQWIDQLNHWYALTVTYFGAIPQSEGHATRSS
jgi:hypothetical protein